MIRDPMSMGWRRPARRAARSGWTLLATLVLAGCSAFGSDRPEPPPYPAVAEQSAWRTAWGGVRTGRAAPGFAPAVVDESLWVAAADGTVTRLARDTGRVEQSFRVAVPLGAGVGADARTVVVVSRNGDVIALETDGRQRWSTPLAGEVVTPPLVAGSIIVVRTIDGRIVALDRDGGSVRWTWQRPMPTLTLRQSTAVAIRSDTLFAGLPGARVVALDLRLGAPRWESVIATPRGATELDRLVDIVGAPALGGDRVCAIAYQGKLACLRSEDGRPVWSRDVSSSAGVAVAGDSVVAIGPSDVIERLRESGDPQWRQDGYVRRGMTTPVVARGRVLFGDAYGSLHALSLEDGRPLARFAIDSTAFASPPLVYDGIAYVQTVGGTVAAIAVP